MNRVREVRRRCKLALQGLAVRAKTSPSMLIYVERYGHIPNDDLRQRIAAALGVSEQELWPELVEQEKGNE